MKRMLLLDYYGPCGFFLLIFTVPFHTIFLIVITGEKGKKNQITNKHKNCKTEQIKDIVLYDISL